MRDALTRNLLNWYDANARIMPWRVAPEDRAAGVRPDPYTVWLSEVMLQQTTVAAVRAYHQRFMAIWPTVHDLAAADDAAVMAEWAGLGYYARARNLLKCARAVVTDHGGAFPDTYDDLLTLPGIGPYTAAAISAIAFDRASVVVDGNVERVMARMYAVDTPLPAAKPQLTAHAAALTPRTRPGDYAQAVMDLGATICTPRSPACGICPWVHDCQARQQGIAAELPKKTLKAPKPVRHGVVYAGRTPDGAWLMETRPEKGLLGGMLGFPGSDWAETPSDHAPPAKADWQTAGEVRHTFTHFHLVLTVMAATIHSPPARGHLIDATTFRPNDLPTLMRKAHGVAISVLPPIERVHPKDVEPPA